MQYLELAKRKLVSKAFLIFWAESIISIIVFLQTYCLVEGGWNSDFPKVHLFYWNELSRTCFHTLFHLSSRVNFLHQRVKLLFWNQSLPAPSPHQVCHLGEVGKIPSELRKAFSTWKNSTLKVRKRLIFACFYNSDYWKILNILSLTSEIWDSLARKSVCLSSNAICFGFCWEFIKIGTLPTGLTISFSTKINGLSWRLLGSILKLVASWNS